MPTLNFYISEEDQRKIFDAHVFGDGGAEELSISQIAGRLVHWFAKNPNATLRRSAIGP
jgi:hypothetical protein